MIGSLIRTALCMSFRGSPKGERGIPRPLNRKEGLAPEAALWWIAREIPRSPLASPSLRSGLRLEAHSE
jgi:hypothetical protein